MNLPRQTPVGDSPCYVVNAQKLTESQIEALAQMLFEANFSHSETIHMSSASLKSYIKNIIETGLRLSSDWFESVETTDPNIER